MDSRMYIAIFFERDSNGIVVLDHDNFDIWAEALVGPCDRDSNAAYCMFQWLDHFGASSAERRVKERALVFGKDDPVACTKTL